MLFYHKRTNRRILKKVQLIGRNYWKIHNLNITVTVPIKKEVTKIDKSGEQITKHISYILQFSDSKRCIASSLSLVKNLSEEVHRIKCKYRHDDKKCETCEIKYNNCDCFHQDTNFKDYLMEFNRIRMFVL